MASSSTLVHLTSRTPLWRPWSIPMQLPDMRRRLCGLLNRLTHANLESVSRKIADMAVSVERTGDPHILDIFVRTIYRHGASDPLCTHVYVDLCQRIVDVLEGERTQWRKVDLFHLGNPMDCFETSLRLRSQYEFDQIIAVGSSDSLRTFAGLAGELLGEGLLFPDDVAAMVDSLFQHAWRGVEGPTLALYRFLSEVTVSFNAIQLLASLDIIERVEALLARGNGLTPRVRYTMMNILDQMLFPRPHDAFASAHHRQEIYGLEVSEPTSETSSVAGTQDESTVPSWHVHMQQARQLLLTRDESAAEEYLKSLIPERREVFITAVVSSALATGDLSDAQLVASFFSYHGVREACDINTFVKGFRPDLTALGDTIIDVPQVARLLATMLQGSPLPPLTVERMVNSHNGPVTERLLDTYTALIQSPGSRSGFTSSVASAEDLHDLRGGLGRVSLGYAL